MVKRKSLAFVLALVMILTLIPASAFAATSNSVDKVPTVAADEIIPTATLSLKVGPGDFTTTAQSIKLTLQNAEWASGSAVTVGTAAPANVIVNSPSFSAVNTIAVTDTTAEFTIVTTDNLKINDVITLALSLKAGSDDGEVKVAIDGLDSSISSGTYTVAVVGSGKTTATVPGTLSSTWRTASFTGAAIEIRENAVNAVGATTQNLRLTLPAGMEWKGVSVSGNMTAAVTPGAFGSRDLDLTVATTDNSSLRQVLVLTPNILVGKDAKMGDITVTIRNLTTGTTKSISNASGLVIGKYVEESVTVKTVKDADIPEFVAGRVDADYKVEVTIEEVIASALAAGRFIDFEFPEWVQITSGASVEVNGAQIATTGKLAEDTSSFEYALSSALSNTVKDKLVFKIPVTIEAGSPAGDVTLTVSGAKAGVETTKLVVGKVVEPITADITVAHLRAGIQNQVLGDIVVKEGFAGALIDKGFLTLDLKDIGGTVKNVKAEVISGDLEIGSKVTTNGTVISIEIKNESVAKASEIKISGATLSLDRTPAQGRYKVAIGGSALVQNAAYNDGDFADSVISADYINVVTPADTGVKAVFKIGEAKYTINGVETAMDAPPYIDAANRTMVPIRFVANAMGISDSQITWDQATQTATIFGNNVVTIKMGSNQIVVNGTAIGMDTVAVNKDGRIFVPVRFIVNALGASVAWDQDTKEVTVYTVK